MKLKSSLILLATLLAGCAQLPVGDDGITTIEGADAIIAMQKELEKPSPSFEKVTVVRFDLDGKRLEVHSITPTVIVAEPARGNRTILNLGATPDKLVLFTRDGRNIKGYRLEIPRAELKPGKRFRFPVAQDPGEVVPREFTVTQVIEQ